MPKKPKEDETAVAPLPEETTKTEEKPHKSYENWMPKTQIGIQVKTGEIKSAEQILSEGKKILETEIVDILIPNLQSELLMIGQSKGKFGGGAKRIFKQTQKKTPEGNKPSFSCMAVVGNSDGYVGISLGSSKDTLPAREKATRNAKRDIFKVERGCGSWECSCGMPHSVPFKVEGKCGSTKIWLMPAPKGTGLSVEGECKKVLQLAGFKDVFSRTEGQTRTKQNLIFALMAALKKLNSFKIKRTTGGAQ